MRLIEKDEALGVIMMNMPVNAEDEYKKGYAAGIAKTVSCIKNMPALNMPKFKTARWVKTKSKGPEFVRCSACGNSVSMLRGQADRFCSQCGAAMFKRETK